ncbi:MAG: flagellar hook-length control protein FliK [Firmicutes bacterium]|nr:flagellar hook-length control protein FliK [Bacillota bacterium]
MLIQGNIMHKMGGGPDETGSRDRTGGAATGADSIFAGLVHKAAARQRPSGPLPAKGSIQHRMATPHSKIDVPQAALTADAPMMVSPSMSVPAQLPPSAPRVRPAASEREGSSARLMGSRPVPRADLSASQPRTVNPVRRRATKASSMDSTRAVPGFETNGRRKGPLANVGQEPGLRFQGNGRSLTDRPANGSLRFGLTHTVPAKGEALAKVAMASELVVPAGTKDNSVTRSPLAATGKSTLTATSKPESAYARRLGERVLASQGAKRDGESQASSSAYGLLTGRLRAQFGASLPSSEQASAQATLQSAAQGSLQAAVRQPHRGVGGGGGTSRTTEFGSTRTAASGQTWQSGESLGVRHLVDVRILAASSGRGYGAVKGTGVVTSLDAADALQAKPPEQPASSRVSQTHRRLPAIRNGSQAGRDEAAAATTALAEARTVKFHAIRKVLRGRESDPNPHAGPTGTVTSTPGAALATPLLFKSNEYSPASPVGVVTTTPSAASFGPQTSGEQAIELSQLARYVMNRLASTGLQTASVVELTLVPANLGKLRLTVDASKGGTLRVHLAATSSSAGALIESQKGQLQQQLSQSGFASVMISVSTDSGGQFQQPTAHPSVVLAPMNEGSHADENDGLTPVRGSWLERGANGPGGFYAEA